MTEVRTVARLGLGGVALAEVMATWKRWELRRALFVTADEHARKAGRRLVVVLPPRESQLTRAMNLYEYGARYGDVLGPAGIGVRAHALARHLRVVEADSAVVYVACALEYVDDLQGTMAEILRVAGNVENIYIVTVQPWTLTAALHPAARWAGISDTHAVSMGPVTALHRGFAAGAVLTLALLSLAGRERAMPKGLPAPQ
jgi:hypothetical protein